MQKCHPLMLAQLVLLGFIYLYAVGTWRQEFQQLQFILIHHHQNLPNISLNFLLFQNQISINRQVPLKSIEDKQAFKSSCHWSLFFLENEPWCFHAWCLSGTPLFVQVLRVHSGFVERTVRFLFQWIYAYPTNLSVCLHYILLVKLRLEFFLLPKTQTFHDILRLIQSALIYINSICQILASSCKSHPSLKSKTLQQHSSDILVMQIYLLDTQIHLECVFKILYRKNLFQVLLSLQNLYIQILFLRLLRWNLEMLRIF